MLHHWAYENDNHREKIVHVSYPGISSSKRFRDTENHEVKDLKLANRVLGARIATEDGLFLL